LVLYLLLGKFLPDSKCKYTFAAIINKQQKFNTMKYVITGSTGHISKPLAQQLAAAGHQVTVVSSNAAKTDEIKALGAQAAIGNLNDLDFITRTFTGADAVYVMIPPPAAGVTNWFASQQQIADNYVAALKAAQTKYAVVLSSVGADKRKGIGPVDEVGYLEEQLLKQSDTKVHFLRPGYFYPNLFGQLGLIKGAGIVGSAQPADFKLVLADPGDIADAAANSLQNPPAGNFTIEYIASDDTATWADVTKALGAAIGKPELPYVQFTDEQSQGGMQQAGFSPTVVEGYLAMGKAMREGRMLADYWNTPVKTIGKVKLADFAKQFAAVYSAS
jgi:uncharacterized protein YbjT (DUF2867 family)